MSVGVLGAGLLTADQAWAAVTERANRFGIVPGTVVDAKGRPVAGNPADPLLGEIMLVPYNFAPRGWTLCQGQLLAISSNTALFSLLGTTYGGDGRTTFGLPELRGRYAMSSGTGPGLSPRSLGQRSGAEQVTLSETQMPSHTHTPQLRASEEASDTGKPEGNVLASGPVYHTGAATHDMGSSSITSANAGGGQSVNNMPPFLVLNYCIALQGVFPSRN